LKLFKKDRIYKNYIAADVIAPPEPKDIMWEHIGYKSSLKKKVLINGIIWLLFVVVLCIIIVFKWVQENYITSEGDSFLKSNGINIAIGVLISSFNGILTAIFRKITIWKKPMTYTAYNYNLAQSVSLGQFFNTSIVII
jgi:hypothetical protein